MSGGGYTSVGVNVLNVTAVIPASVVSDGSISTDTIEAFSLVGGVGLDISTGGDAVKVVSSTGACSDAAGGGTVEITDLSANGATRRESGAVEAGLSKEMEPT